MSTSRSLFLAITLTLFTLVSLPAQLMTADGFESGTFDLWRLQTWGEHNMGTIAAPPVPFEREKAFRAVAGPSSSSYGNHWCEVGRYFADLNTTRWWGFAVFFPEDWAYDRSNTVISQVHSANDRELGEEAQVPLLVFRLDGDKLIIETRWDENKVSKIEKYGMGGTVKNVRLWEGPLELGKWMRFVFHAHFSYEPEGSGFVQVWLDGEQIVDYKGPNAFNNEAQLSLRVGLYKRYHKELAQDQQQVAWFDSFIIADENANYDMVEPRPERFVESTGRRPSSYQGPMHNQQAPADAIESSPPQ